MQDKESRESTTAPLFSSSLCSVGITYLAHFHSYILVLFKVSKPINLLYSNNAFLILCINDAEITFNLVNTLGKKQKKGERELSKLKENNWNSEIQFGALGRSEILKELHLQYYKVDLDIDWTILFILAPRELTTSSCSPCCWKHGIHNLKKNAKSLSFFYQ